MRRALQHLGDWQSLGAGIDAAERGSARAILTAGAFHDVRYAWRAMCKNPSFAAIAVLTLAFGIGGNTAIFTMVDAVALRNLPYRDPDRLMAIETRKTAQPEIEPWTSAPDFLDFREQARSFQSVVAVSPVWNVVLYCASRQRGISMSGRLLPHPGGAGLEANFRGRRMSRESRCRSWCWGMRGAPLWRSPRRVGRSCESTRRTA